MWFLKSKKKEKKMSKTEVLVKLANRKLTQLKRKSSSDIVDDLSFLFKIFLSEVYSINKNLTLEKICEKATTKKMTKEIKIEILSIRKDLDDVKYSGKKYSKKQTLEILDKIKLFLKNY